MTKLADRVDDLIASFQATGFLHPERMRRQINIMLEERDKKLADDIRAIRNELDDGVHGHGNVSPSVFYRFTEVLTKLEGEPEHV